MCDVSVKERLPGVTGLVDELVVASVNVRIYALDHTRVSASIDAVTNRVIDMIALEDGPDPALTLGVVEGCLVHDGRPLVGASLSAARIIDTIERLESGGIRFSRGVTPHDVLGLIQALSARPGSVANYREANLVLEQGGAQAVRFLGPGEAGGFAFGADGGSIYDDAGTVRLPAHLYRGVVGCLQNMTVNICRGNSFELVDANRLMIDILTELDEEPTGMMNLSRYEQYDAYTFGHSIRVSFLALNFARTLTPDRGMQRRVGLAALLHDIGKARVPFEIVHSTSRYTDDERREMEKHVVHGGEILLELAEVEPLAVAAAFGHHRSYDGGGYPRTPHTPDLSYVTRIVKICDVFEALTAVRPYKASMTPARAFDLMLKMEGHFDPTLLKRFIYCHGIYPNGSLVMLSSGETARVVEQTSTLRQPIVSVRTTPNGDLLDEGDQRSVDLSHLELGDTIRVAHGPVMTQSTLIA